MRPVHFECQSPDPASSREFFSRVLGWQFQQWNDFPYWLATTGPDDQPGIHGALMPSPDREPRTVITVDVPDVADALERVSEAGGEMVLPIQDIPEVGKVAYAREPQGIVFGLFQAADSTHSEEVTS